MPPPRLTGLFRYPLKSAGGVSLEQAEVEERGLAGDRRWMVVDVERRPLTQIEVPRLAAVRPGPGPSLVLQGPGRAPLAVAPPEPGPAWSVRLGRTDVEVLPAGPEAASWLSAFLGRPCTLVSMPASTRQPVNPAYAKHGEIAPLSNGYPLMLMSESSLADLNARLARPLSMERFRPSLVISGAEPYAEDRWRRFRIGEVELTLAKPCDRCAITTVDQTTGLPDGPEPLATLAQYRRRDSVVVLGLYLLHRAPGTLRLGDAVEVLEEG